MSQKSIFAAVLFAVVFVCGGYGVWYTAALTTIGLTLTNNPALEEGLLAHWTFDGDAVGTVQEDSGDPWCNDSSGVTCNGDWTARRKITFNNSASAENLTDFPVLISLNNTRVDYAKTQDQGQDIRFVDPSDPTTVLSHEIESWNESGTSTVWVKVPQIDAATTTDFIWIYYGNDSVADGEDASNVWATNYKGVWHLKEDPTPKTGSSGCDGGTKEACDSTSNANNADSAGSMNSADQVDGRANGAMDFDGADDLLNAGSDASLDNFFDGGGTIST